MNEVLKFIVSPAVTLFIVFLAASPFAFAVYCLMVFVKWLVGPLGAIVLYCAEVGALVLWAAWYEAKVTEAINSDAIDGPVAFGAAMEAGFLMLFAAAMVILNAFGLWRIIYRPRK